jgi:hypothetical protein
MPGSRCGAGRWECRVFIAVAEHRTFAAAAKALTAQTGKEYGSRAVAKVIAKVERWLGVPPFEQTLSRAKQTTARGEDFLRAARAIVGEYQALREPERAFTVPTLACVPHHLHMVARAEAALARKTGLRVEFLDRDSYVGTAAFGRYAVWGGCSVTGTNSWWAHRCRATPAWPNGSPAQRSPAPPPCSPSSSSFARPLGSSLNSSECAWNCDPGLLGAPCEHLCQRRARWAATFVRLPHIA